MFILIDVYSKDKEALKQHCCPLGLQKTKKCNYRLHILKGHCKTPGHIYHFDEAVLYPSDEAVFYPSDEAVLYPSDEAVFYHFDEASVCLWLVNEHKMKLPSFRKSLCA